MTSTWSKFFTRVFSPPTIELSNNRRRSLSETTPLPHQSFIAPTTAQNKFENRHSHEFPSPPVKSSAMFSLPDEDNEESVYGALAKYGMKSYKTKK
jgi:hypothetical protein